MTDRKKQSNVSMLHKASTDFTVRQALEYALRTEEIEGFEHIQIMGLKANGNDFLVTSGMTNAEAYYVIMRAADSILFPNPLPKDEDEGEGEGEDEGEGEGEQASAEKHTVAAVYDLWHAEHRFPETLLVDQRTAENWDFDSDEPRNVIPLWVGKMSDEEPSNGDS